MSHSRSQVLLTVIKLLYGQHKHQMKTKTSSAEYLKNQILSVNERLFQTKSYKEEIDIFLHGYQLYIVSTTMNSQKKNLKINSFIQSQQHFPKIFSSHSLVLNLM